MCVYRCYFCRLTFDIWLLVFLVLFCISGFTFSFIFFHSSLAVSSLHSIYDFQQSRQGWFSGLGFFQPVYSMENFFILRPTMASSLAGCSSLGGQACSSRTCSTLPQFLCAFKVLIKNSAASLLGFSLYMASVFFSLVSCIILSLFWLLSVVTEIRYWEFLFWFYLVFSVFLISICMSVFSLGEVFFLLRIWSVTLTCNYSLATTHWFVIFNDGANFLQICFVCFIFFSHSLFECSSSFLASG